MTKQETSDPHTSNPQSYNNEMEEKNPVQQMKQVYLQIESQKKINLFGLPGVGKTRMAKKVSDRAIKNKLFDFTLWMFMCRGYTVDSLAMSIARQLFLIRTYEEWEIEDDNSQQQGEREQQNDHEQRQRDHKQQPDGEQQSDGKQQQDQEQKRDHEQQSDRKQQGGHDDQLPDTRKLITEIQNKLKGYKTLVILDDVLDGETKSSNEKKFWEAWEQMFPADLNLDIKTILISRLKRKDPDYSEENAIEVKPLRPKEVAIKLLKEKLDTQLSEKIHDLGKQMIGRFSGDLPAGTVIIIAKVLNYFRLDVSGVSALKKELEEASENYRVSKLLSMKDDVLPTGILKDLWWSGHHFYRDSGSVHYSELITYWILEGYLGVGSMPNLYKRGHGVLIELIDCGVLKVQEGGHVFMDKSLIDVRDLYKCVDQNPRLGFATVITSEEEGFGRITHNDGMLKTTTTRPIKKELKPTDKRGQNLSTLLLDGTHATERVIIDFLESEKELKVFGLFHPTIKALPKSLETIERLRVLVLRGVEFLQDTRISLKALEVLEISNALTLRRLNSGFFKNLLNLKSLHLSGLQIRSLPQAIYNLQNIQWLIVKDCPRLRKLESISKLSKLIVVDLSGNTKLDTLDKNFLKFEKLQSLNLSKTMVSTTPLLKNRKELTHLFCTECPGLVRLRGLTSLTSLQTIDLSGSQDFEEFHDSSLQSLSSLITMNLSGTRIDRLPSNISKPRYLYLRSCLSLHRLACIASFVNLEVLDLSGSSNLNEIEKKFFDEMSRLRVLNISKTNISHLPSLSSLSSLREFYLSHCHSLTNLPSLDSATKLEILDASNCFALHEMESKTFEAMTQLQKIDFSETKIESLPSLPNPCNVLQKLLLKNCNALQKLELKGVFAKLEELNLSGIKKLEPNGAEFVKDVTSLRILDLSYTSINQLPSLKKLTNLTHLSLAGCSFSSEFELDCPCNTVEVLDLSRSSIKIPNLSIYTNLRKLLLKNEIPNDVISTFTHLEYLEFSDMTAEGSQDEVNQDHWNICELSQIDKPPLFLTATQFQKKKPLPPYHLFAVPAKVEGETWDTYLQRHELMFRDVYLQACRFTQYKENKTLQIHGFNQFPKGFDDIINDVDLVLLIDYKLKGFPSGFDPSMFKNLKGCWIERCNELVTIFDEKEGHDNPGFQMTLESLGICNNIGLKSIYGGKQAFGSFDSLKSLYIDSCSELSTVFSSTWLPKKLQVLEIKYCDKILDFGGHLPESLQTLKIWECPKVKQLEDQFAIPKDLKTLWISGATSLKNLTPKDDTLISLETLKVENCPMLEYIAKEDRLISLKTLKVENSPMIEYIVPSSWGFKNIEIIEIRSCEKMQTLFTDNEHKNTWSQLKKMRLEDLPMLKQIGAFFPNLPASELVEIECPNLQILSYD